MHPYSTDILVRDHQATLRREAQADRMASAAAAARRNDPAPAAFMPHVQEGGRLRRAIAALLRPMPA